MPVLGLGTYKTPAGAEVENAVRAALDTGYRSIDTATLYDNEKGIGRALKESGVPRERVFITTKVWNTEQGYRETLKAFDQSRKKLKTEYVDLYLIHWPVRGRYIETWRAMEELLDRGVARAIGVSNFMVHHLEYLMLNASIVPMVNQFELHPRLYQAVLVDFCRSKEIRVEGWAPLMRGRLNSDPIILGLCGKYGKTPSQILVRWALEHGFVTIPKSVHRERIAENARVFDFSLSIDDVELIDSFDRGERTGPDPDNFDF
ncbi:MAG TPA: aldo/keto reductase [Spirochaetota bacterium]|nr:aldo/keto reductase [Spirochaetota bacterium]